MDRTTFDAGDKASHIGITPVLCIHRSTCFTVAHRSIIDNTCNTAHIVPIVVVIGYFSSKVIIVVEEDVLQCALGRTKHAVKADTGKEAIPDARYKIALSVASACIIVFIAFYVIFHEGAGCRIIGSDSSDRYPTVGRHVDVIFNKGIGATMFARATIQVVHVGDEPCQSFRCVDVPSTVFVYGVVIVGAIGDGIYVLMGLRVFGYCRSPTTIKIDEVLVEFLRWIILTRVDANVSLSVVKNRAVAMGNTIHHIPKPAFVAHILNVDYGMRMGLSGIGSNTNVGDVCWERCLRIDI